MAAHAYCFHIGNPHLSMAAKKGFRNRKAGQIELSGFF
jgi:hypothetical protein